MLDGAQEIRPLLSHCGLYRANEAFSGHGHNVYLCKRCSRVFKVEIQKADHLRTPRDMLFHQSNISRKNLLQLADLAKIPIPEVALLPSLIAEIGSIHPGKRRRIRFLAKTRRELVDGLVDARILSPRADTGDLQPDELDPPDSDLLSWDDFDVLSEARGPDEPEPVGQNGTPYSDLDDQDFPF